MKKAPNNSIRPVRRLKFSTFLPLGRLFGNWSLRFGISSLWIHATLIAGTLIFLFPFLWMVVTSLKTDEELTEPSWWPTMPAFRSASPYARRPVEVSRPQEVDPSTWNAALPLLRERTLRAAADLSQPGNVPGHPDAAASLLLSRLIPRISRSTWEAGPQQVADAYQALLTRDAIAAAMDDRLAAVELRGLQIRSLDADVFNIAGGGDVVDLFRIESGGGSITPVEGAARLAYTFASPDAAPVVLRADFELPCPPDQLHKLILAMRPDNSWHRLDATLDVAGVRWTSTRATYLSQHRPLSVIFQPPGFDDTTMQPRTWVPLRRENAERGMMNDEQKTGGTPSSPSADSAFSIHHSAFPLSATLRLTLSPSSTLQATRAKVLRNYSRAFYAVPFWRYVANSILLVALTTLGTLFSSTFVAYAFARLRWPGRGVALVVLLATMMLPPQVTMVPSFLIWRSLGWYNTLNPLWVPAFFGGAFFIFLMTQHMKSIPRELEESAHLDGLNAVQTWYYIILPQVKPAAAAIAIMTFMWSWNEFLGPLVYLRDQAKFPLSLGLFGLRLENFGDWSLIMAANVLMTLPVIVIFFLCQRYFIQGMTMSGMKG